MEKYRSAPLNTAYPMTNNNHRFLNTTTSGPLYTMGGSTNFQQQYHGPQLLMNTNSVGTSTQFQFVPARNHHHHHHHSTNNPTANNNFTGSFQFDFSNSIAPIFNGVKTFFTNLLKPTTRLESSSETMMRTMMNYKNTATTTSSTEKRKSNSAPNIYTGIMSPEDGGGGKCVGDFDKSCFVDVADYEMLAKLSSSTKSFSDYNLPSSTMKSSSTAYCSSPSSTHPERTQKTDVPSLEETTLPPNPTKETNVEKSSSVPVPSLQSTTKSLNFSISKPNVPTKSRRSGCTDGNRAVKQKSNKKSKRKSGGGGGKNRKEKDRHALALKIHEDCETEIETMSTDEWDEPLVIITTNSTVPSIEASPETLTSKVVSFSTEDFPAMPQCTKQIWELPRLSHCLAALNGKRKQRQLSECDSEDSFIVFDNNDKLTPSSVESNQSICDRIRSRLSMGGSGGGSSGGRQRQLSESSDDDFICFEMEESDAESDCDDDDDDDDVADCDQDTSDSECESEVDVKSSGTNPPDSGFEDKKVSEFLHFVFFLFSFLVPKDIVTKSRLENIFVS